MSNLDPESSKLFLLIFLIALFLVSAYQSWKELRLTLNGQTCPGKIYRKAPAGRMHSEAALYYEFKDKKGKTYKGRISVSWPRAEEILKREIKVVYIKSDPEINTLQSQRSLLWPLIFLGMFATLLTGSIVLLAKASMSDRKKEKENLLL